MKVRTTIAATTLVVATALTGCGSAADKTNTSGDATSKVVAGTDGGASAEEVAETTKGKAVLKVAEYGFTQLPKSDYSGPSVSYALIITNDGDAIGSNAQVQISFEGADGSVVDSQEDYATAVLPGTSVALAGYLPDAAGVKKMTVQLLPGQDEALEDKPANFTVSKVKTKTQEYTDVKTTATVTSPFTKDLKDVEAVAVYRNAKGKIIGGDDGFVNFIPAKGKASVSIESMAFEKVPANTEVYVALSSLSLLGD